MKEIQLLHFTQSMDKGGLEEVVYNLAKFSTPKFKITIGCFQGGFLAEKIRQIPHVNLSILPYPQNRWQWIKFIVWLRKFNLIVVHYCLMASISALRARRPLVEIVHNLYGWFDDDTCQRFEKICRKAHGIVAVSEQVRIFTENNFFSAPHPRFITINNGIDLARLDPDPTRPPFRTEIGANSDSVVIGSVSALAEAKNLELFIRAVPELARCYPQARFVVVGSGYWEDRLKEYAKECGASQLIFTGFRADVGHVLKGIDIFVIPSLYEGLPMALLEAMGAGKAVVCAPVGGIVDVVEDEINGLLLPDYELKTFIDVVGRLVEEPSLRQGLGERALATIRNSCDARDMVRRHEEYYLSLLK